eukprot:RCo037007
MPSGGFRLLCRGMMQRQCSRGGISSFTTSSPRPAVPPAGSPGFWDEISPGYDRSFFGWWCSRHVPFLLKAAPPPSRADRGAALDFGAGTGAVSLAVLRSSPVEVIAQDPSPGMLTILRTKLAGFSPEVRSRVRLCGNLGDR